MCYNIIVFQVVADQVIMPLTPILKKQSYLASPASSKRVIFTTQETARSVILNYHKTGDSSHFARVLHSLLMSGSQSEQLSWLSQMTECVSLLDRRADKLVLEFLVSFFNFD